MGPHIKSLSVYNTQNGNSSLLMNKEENMFFKYCVRNKFRSCLVTAFLTVLWKQNEKMLTGYNLRSKKLILIMAKQPIVLVTNWACAVHFTYTFSGTGAVAWLHSKIECNEPETTQPWDYPSITSSSRTCAEGVCTFPFCCITFHGDTFVIKFISKDISVASPYYHLKLK